MNVARTSIWIAVSVLSIASLAIAQTPDTATLQGQVLDQSSAAVPGVKVVITNHRSGLQRSTETDSSGGFVVSGLPISGPYEIVATHAGFADATASGIELVGGRTSDVILQMSASGGKTEVTVVGTAGEVRTDVPQIGTLLGSVEIEKTPLLNRRITYLPLLNAANRQALNQGDAFMNQNLFTTNGAGRRQAWFEVDGSTGNDSWGRQTVFTNIPLDATEAMDVLTNSFSAEYGLTAGSVINIVTKSGSNAYHGDVLALWRPSDIGAKLSGFVPQSATSGTQITSDELTQAAASFGGPLGKGGHTQFFVAGEYSWQNRASPVTSPVAPGSFVGKYRDWLAFVRVDHQFSEKNNLFFRANADQYTDTNPGGAVGGNTLPTAGRAFKRHTYSAELGDTAQITPRLLNSARLQFQLASPITQFDPFIFSTQYVVPISTGGTFTSGTSQSAYLQNRQYEFSDTVSTVRGRHSLKFGGDMIYAHSGGNSKEFGGPIFLGQFQYKPCTLDLSICESSAYIGDIANVKSYTQSFGTGDYTVDDTLWSLFVQDDIRVRPNLMINVGMRYEHQTFTDANLNFAPRVGFVYNIHGDGKTVLRGGFGIYYSQIVDNAQANYALTGPTGVFNYTATPGQIGFPDSVADAPLPQFPAGAPVPLRTLYIRPGRASYYDQFLPTSVLNGYPDALLNPYTQQWTFGFERELGQNWVLGVDYVGSHALRINRPLDIDTPAPFVRSQPGLTRTAQAANCTRPLWIAFYQQNGTTCDPTTPSNPQPPYATVFTDVNNGFGYYNALDINLQHRFRRRFSMLASYTWSHAINNVDPDVPGQNPNDPNFTASEEIGNAVYDQRHRFVLSGTCSLPLKFEVGGVATLASGLPYNIVTGANNFGDPGATTDRPVIDGVVVPRNAGRGRSIYDVSPFVERPFAFGERVVLNIRAEAFNVFNHANFVGYSGTWGNGATPGNGFGQPLTGITNQLPARSFQFSARLSF